MLYKLRKFPRYLVRLLRLPPLQIAQIMRYVKTKHLFIALAAYVDRRSVAVELRHQLGMQDIQLFLKLLPYRRRCLKKKFYLWNYEGRYLCATHLQFIGLYAEYLTGQFEELYAYDWRQKVVLDIGGFVGDSALHFLEKGARQVIIYEPLPENIFALNYNLKSYKGKVCVYQKAIAKQEGPLILSSNSPGGALGFGMEKGCYQVECVGITLQQILKQHAVDVVKVDCEGGEEFLVEVPAKDLQAIPYWIIETHSPAIYEKIMQKFHECGFSKLKEVYHNPMVSLLHFIKSASSAPVSS